MHWQGLRQDSGDAFAFAPRAKEVYENLGVDYRQKTIVYSDALSVGKCLRLKEQCEVVGFKRETFLSNLSTHIDDIIQHNSCLWDRY
jgi:nicotinic acid phosphoribosyltransferase